jgi:hypothetical protein
MRRVSLSVVGALMMAGVLSASTAHAQHTPAHRLDPKFVASFGGGAGGWARGMFDATWPGFTWQGRLGVQLCSWFAIDGSYAGQFNAGYAPVSGPGIGVVNHTLSADVRFIIPTRYVQPYALVGLGPSFTNVVRWNGAQNTPLQNSVSGAIPMAVGLATQLSKHWGVSAEAGYQRSFGGGGYSTIPAYSTGDLWTGVLSVNYQM